MTFLRTTYPIYYFFFFSSFFIKGCDGESIPLDLQSEGKAIVVSNTTNATNISTDPIPNKSKIKVIDTTKENSTKTVSSGLNNHTELTVGVIDDQYAVLINSSKEKYNSSTNPIASIVDQKFGDEIEEEKKDIVTLITSEPEKNELLAIGDDLFIEKSGDIVLPANYGEVQKPAEPNFDIKQIDAAYLLGKFNPATHKDFTKISSAYANKKGMYIRKDTYAAFKKMYQAASKQGIHLNVISATRSFSAQKRIWEAKWSGKRRVNGKDLSKAIPFGVDRAKKILEFSAMPGTSRHHWGTDLDLVALENEFFDTPKGKKIYDWLVANAESFGFHQPYTKWEERKSGHSEEKWHWSYTPISQALTKKYAAHLKNETINGFLGQETTKDIDMLNNFVLGVDENCK